MDTRLVKFVILWTICEIIGVIISIPLNDSHAKTKRSPAKNLPLLDFGVQSRISIPSLITRAVSFHNQNISRHSVEPQIISNNNAVSPIETSYRSGIPHSMALNASTKNVDKIIVQEEDKNKVKEPKRKVEEPKNKSENYEIEKKLVDYIFQVTPNYNIDNTTDTSLTDATGTEDYGTTTDELLRIAAPVVASLLG